MYRCRFRIGRQVSDWGQAGCARYSRIILAVGRVVGETAALIFTAGTVAEYAGFMDSGRTLAVHMYVLSSEGLHMDQAYATAVVLLIFVFAMNRLSEYAAERISKGHVHE